MSVLSRKCALGHLLLGAAWVAGATCVLLDPIYGEYVRSIGFLIVLMCTTATLVGEFRTTRAQARELFDLGRESTRVAPLRSVAGERGGS